MSSSIEGVRSAVQYSGSRSAPYGVIPKDRLQPTLARIVDELRLLNEADTALRADPLSIDARTKLAAFSLKSELGGAKAEKLCQTLNLQAQKPSLSLPEELEALKTAGLLPEVAKKLEAARDLIANAIDSRPNEDLNVRGPVLDQLIRNAEARGQDGHWAIRADQTGNSDFEITPEEVSAFQARLDVEAQRSFLELVLAPLAKLELWTTFTEAEGQVAARSKEE